VSLLAYVADWLPEASSRKFASSLMLHRLDLVGRYCGKCCCPEFLCLVYHTIIMGIMLTCEASINIVVKILLSLHKAAIIVIAGVSISWYMTSVVAIIIVLLSWYVATVVVAIGWLSFRVWVIPVKWAVASSVFLVF